ncbi:MULTISPECIES: aconitate hydratase [Paenarthrobacter]|jgi:aconitate hydratase|uniref:Aconitate hydratase n=1 Tax=Paenarthrobacter nicotinovorans TaxID=29320 RepID=A0ABT9TQ18_PAENI|nr:MULTISPECIES: aconitate hydratase [Paenarthrobacter]KIA73527.1 aconitate hydratase 1 [Arthrobacter sp. MWB30]KQQ98091.1 aconitate hydratase [Arthrobacter sp. Leaf145]SKB57901.1 aconitase [Arthrobacter sp. 31Cvi3.1E]BCW10434.1 aconitate hydratase [Arthrobacter sp. NtRootA2]BCW14515.1 aconitate hydratase [Arthrobacter sp. NtRootA4]BCW22850.1 aconitate hydratase [Arthrobacter sp. NtRootC7]BCW27120.1 aconitate hydratase [Arthrobacter sp. NtRootC45]BCW31387.1 aconitate hydratase [Arthrobacter
MSTVDSFGSKGVLNVAGTDYEIFRLNSVEGADSLPFSLKVLLENLLRTEDGANITADHVRALAGWDPNAEPDTEIQFTPARVIMQDFTGVPCVVDLATMREAVKELGGDPKRVNPLAPAEMVIDHSVQIDAFGNSGALERNMEIEYQRNGERYQFLRWGQTAFDDFKVVPPGTGIVHQVNIEYLARTVMTREVDGVVRAYPDTCVGTDSHTTMVNGLGILGWGVGGIEAEAAMLGQPVSMLIPRVVGFKLNGSIPAGATATDVVLTITEMLRKHGVVGKFVEFYGEGVAAVPLANRATIGNMSPEFGSTAAMFPIDDVTLDYLRLTGRSEENVALVEAYTKEQGLWHDPSRELRFSEFLELDLSTVVPSISGPKRPQDRIELTDAKEQFRKDIHNYVSIEDGSVDEALDESFPASDSPSFTHADSHTTETARVASAANGANGRPSSPVHVKTADGREFELDHGAVSIASITSCTNTSNPSVMLAAALLARNAVDKGLTSKPWVKTSVAPGSKVVTDYYEKSGLTPYLEKLGFYIVGYGCATCIGNSGPLEPEISEAIQANDLSVTAVLSGNRNFEGRINPDVKMNYLASPPLVIAYALAGSMDFDFDTDALGTDSEGNEVFLKDIWPNPTEVQEVIDSSIDEAMFAKGYEGVFDGDDRWKALDTPAGDTFAWAEDSTYVRKPPYFEGMKAQPDPVKDISGARVLLKLGDSVTTDHISPAGSFKSDTPAGQYLLANGVERKDFNSYGSRRGNHEVMIRGTFANIRIKNQLLDGVEGGFTRDFSQEGAPQAYVYDAAQNYQAAGTPLVVLAGKEYGSGSSRDWAAKGTALLGVKAVIAESYERIHRSNLIGMGVLPLQFPAGESAATLGLTGTETFAVEGVTELNNGTTPKTLKVTATAEDGTSKSFDAVLRIDTPGEADYYRNGGILQYVLRQISA